MATQTNRLSLAAPIMRPIRRHTLCQSTKPKPCCAPRRTKGKGLTSSVLKTKRAKSKSTCMRRKILMV
ncbi:Uncharacterised protein [Vibrio cholerae]|uniref:Uncharacterized protein n=1 Tax=Vibrio cholerae TaxID=666 RepID=A0A655XE22_VIBCL|nr:Uncharacterised protein [Vibrio cholerae]